MFMFMSVIFSFLVYPSTFSAAVLPANGAVTNAIASSTNLTVPKAGVGYPPGGRFFQPTPPNPMRLLYKNRARFDPPPLPPQRTIPFPLIPDCVDSAILAIDTLIVRFGPEARIRTNPLDGRFSRQSLTIEFFPTLQEPTYQDVRWCLLALKEAYLDDLTGFGDEATVFATNTQVPWGPGRRGLPVTRIDMGLMGQGAEAVAVE